jgi:hypothetical protein
LKERRGIGTRSKQTNDKTVNEPEQTEQQTSKQCRAPFSKEFSSSILEAVQPLSGHYISANLVRLARTAQTTEARTAVNHPTISLVKLLFEFLDLVDDVVSKVSCIIVPFRNGDTLFRMISAVNNKLIKAEERDEVEVNEENADSTFDYRFLGNRTF